MSLVSQLTLLISAIGADIKGLQTKAVGSSIDPATRLIQTQKIMAQIVLRDQL